MTFIDRYGFKWDNQLSEKIFDESPIGLAFVSVKDGKFLRVNKTLCEMLEYNEWELLDKTFPEITSGADIQSDLRAVEELKSGHRSSYSMRKSYITKGREIIEIMLYVKSIYENGKDGEISFFLSSIIPCEIIIDNKSNTHLFSKNDIDVKHKDKHSESIIDILKNNFLQLLVLLGTVIGFIYQYGKSQETTNQRILSIEKELKAIVTKNDEFFDELKELLKDSK